MIEPRKVAQLEAEKTYSDFIAWSKTAFYCILAFLIVLAFLNFEPMEQEANTTEVNAPKDVGYARYKMSAQKKAKMRCLLP